MTADSRHHPPAATVHTPPARGAIVLGAAGALLQALGGVLETVDRVTVGEPGFALRTTLIGAAYLLLVGAVVALARSGAAGPGVAGKAGLGVAGAGWVLSAVAQLVLNADAALAEQVLFPLATVAVGAGMAMAGVAVVRARRWLGWRRWVPLLCGIYPFAVIFPVFAATGGPSFPVLSGWGLCWLILAGALWTAPALA